MPDKCFIDTNVLIYIYSTDKIQQEKALLLIYGVKEPVISQQVIIEFCNVMTKKLKVKKEDITFALQDFQENLAIVPLEHNMIQKGLEIQEKYQYSYYDSLIIAAALLTDCKILYTEDMQNGQIIEKKLRITNPFL